MTLESVNPATGEVIATYPEMTAIEVDEIIGACHETQLGRLTCNALLPCCESVANRWPSS